MTAQYKTNSLIAKNSDKMLPRRIEILYME